MQCCPNHCLVRQLDQSQSDWEQGLYSTLAFIPHSISEVHFSLNTAHHPLSFPLQEVIFHPEIQFYTFQIVCQYSISFDWCAIPQQLCYSYYKHQPQFSLIPSLRNKAQAESSSDSRLYVIRYSRSWWANHFLFLK